VPKKPKQIVETSLSAIATIIAISIFLKAIIDIDLPEFGELSPQNHFSQKI